MLLQSSHHNRTIERLAYCDDWIVTTYLPPAWSLGRISWLMPARQNISIVFIDVTLVWYICVEV